MSTPFVWECPYGICSGDGFEVFERIYPLSRRGEDPEHRLRERLTRPCRCARERRAVKQEWQRAQRGGRNGDASYAASGGSS